LLENQSINKAQVIAKAVLKIAVYFLVLIVILFSFLLIALRIPAVQTWVVQEASAFLSEKTGHRVTVQGVDIRFFSRILLDQVQVLDYKEEELFYVGRIEADISAFSIFRPNHLQLASLTLEEPRARLIQYQGTDTLNVTTFVRAVKRLINKKEDADPSSFHFGLDGLNIRNGSFVYFNQNAPPAAEGIDYSHLVIDNLQGNFSEIDFLGDTIQVTVTGLQAHETRSGTRIHELNTRMNYAPTFWEWADLMLRINDSRLAEYIRFDYRRFGNFANFIDSVRVTANFRDAAVYAQDVAVFAPQLREYQDMVRLSADVTGTVTNFNARNVEIRYGENTRLVGDISANGLPNLQETFADLDLKSSTINARDLKGFLPAESFPVAARLGTVTFTGEFLGFPTDFVAAGSFITALGRVESDINLKIEQNRNASSYRGYLKTVGFNVGRLIGDESLIQTLSMTGRVEGLGFDLDQARLKLNADIQDVNLKNYNYRNITTNATLSRQTFTGDLQINDPNLNFAVNGNVDFRKENRIFDIRAQLGHADLQALKLTGHQLVLQTDVRLNFTGSNLDNILGEAQLGNAAITYNDRQVLLDTIDVRSSLEDGIRLLTVSSDLADLRAYGEFDYLVLLDDIQTLVEEYRLKFESNEFAIATYYRQKKYTQAPDYEVKFTADFKQINPLLHLFVPQLSVARNTYLEGSLRNGTTAILAVYAKTDTLLYNNAGFFRNSFEIHSSKLPMDREVLASAIFTSAKQTLPGAGNTDNFYVEGVWDDKTIRFSTSITQTGTSNRANISGDLNFMQDQLQLVFNQSNVNILGREWHISPANSILITGAGKEITFKNFKFAFQDQSITLAGDLSQNQDQTLQIAFNDFQLSNINPILPEQVQGRLNARLQLRDVYDQMILNSRITIDSLHLNNLLLGDFHGSSDWDHLQRRLQIAFDLEQARKRVLNVSGFFSPQEQEQQLNLLAVMDDAQVKMVEPILKDLFHDMEGLMAGRINVSGRLNSPILKGSAEVKKGRFTFTYLNTTYSLNDRIYFTENSIAFRNLRLQDLNGNQATVNGGIFHDGFSNMVIDLKASFTRFMVLNTTRANNELYYGNAIATGQASVLGAPDNLIVQVDARSEKGTFMFIPLDNSTSVSRQPFITFINRYSADTTAFQANGEKQETNLSGINLTFNLDITEDAETSIIFNERAGDIIRGRGNGRIRLVIDTRGDFSMFGNYEIVRGAYNFTLAGLISKEFMIREGGTISWSGDPLGGTMDLTAAYRQLTRLPFLENQGAAMAADAANRVRYPVTAVMALKGSLMSPEIRLGLEIEQVPPALEASVAAFLNRIRNDEQELNRQVFSLLAFRQLSPENEFIAGGAAGGALSSLSDFVSGQFSNWISQVDRNLEVDIGLADAGQLDQSAVDALQVRIGYSLLGGRLRVSREGGVSNANQGVTGMPQNSVVGDWMVEYYLRPDGKLRLKMHYNTTPRRFDTNNSVSAGFSVLHTERFDTFEELFARKRPRKRDRQLEDENEKILMDSDERLLLQR
jgi:hypothetical protein